MVKSIEDDIEEAAKAGQTVWVSLFGEENEEGNDSDYLSIEGLCERDGRNYVLTALRDDSNEIVEVIIGAENINQGNMGYGARRQDAQVKRYNNGDEGYAERLKKVRDSGLWTSVSNEGEDILDAIFSSIEEPEGNA